MLVGGNSDGSQMTKQRKMKRFNNLYDRIISLENLELADKKARKGKLQQKGVMIFDKHRDENLKILHEMLKNETFKTSKYTVFKVFEPKEREIYRLPYFPDRIVHHAIMNVLEPIWLSVFTHNTYSCIKDRGISASAKQVERIIKSFSDRLVHCKDGEKELKFFTNCKMIKDILSQLTEKDFPFFTTIATVRDGSHKYYKFT